MDGARDCLCPDWGGCNGGVQPLRPRSGVGGASRNGDRGLRGAPTGPTEEVRKVGGQESNGDVVELRLGEERREEQKGY